MAPTLAFDVYGTLIDTHGVVAALQPHLGGRAFGFSSLWREKQLEYSFRRGLMQNYETFAVCTRQALAYAVQAFKLELAPAQTEALLEVYGTLPAFGDARAGLEMARTAGFRLLDEALRAEGIATHSCH